MSAQHASADGPDPANHPIIPDDFCEAWDADTVADALRAAEDAPSTTDHEDMTRCPECLSVRIHWKGENGCAHQREPDRKCVNCGAHFDHALPAPSDAHRRAAHAPAADRPAARPRCPDCGSPRLYPVPERAAAVDAPWVCRACLRRIDEPAPSHVATLRAQAQRRRSRDRPSWPDAHEQATLGEVDR